MTDNQVEQPASAVAPNEKGKATKKKAAPAVKAKKVADHPKYSEMIKEALGVLKVRTDCFEVLNLPLARLSIRRKFALFSIELDPWFRRSYPRNWAWASAAIGVLPLTLRVAWLIGHMIAKNILMISGAWRVVQASSP